ncbi:MAG TPA: CoA pyrophosphatase [Anaerolineales bacterium]|jgi:8-oxo-dGTP pyrophosphatase MutT (NUDIX family)
MELAEANIAQKLRAAEQNSAASERYLEMDIPAGAVFRCAAVLVPLTFVQDEWHLLFTRRTDLVESHKGQVSFPGGACDEGETSAEATALREAEEEIGLKPSDVRVLGRLSPLITVSSYEVSPIVAAVPWPYAFQIATIEVARLFTIPLNWLADRSNYWEFMRRDNRSLIAYHPYDGELLWGATARMTLQLIKTLEMHGDES